VVLNEQGLTPAAHAALQKLAALRAEATARENARRALQGEIDAVEHDEQRLRANLAAVPPTEALHTRLVRQLDTDEQRIGQLGQSIADADEAVRRARKALDEAIGSLQL
jgi:predicted  nucleic acid-binding Zn-ribbon protein